MVVVRGAERERLCTAQVAGFGQHGKRPELTIFDRLTITTGAEQHETSTFNRMPHLVVFPNDTTCTPRNQSYLASDFYFARMR